MKPFRIFQGIIECQIPNLNGGKLPSGKDWGEVTNVRATLFRSIAWRRAYRILRIVYVTFLPAMDIV